MPFSGHIKKTEARQRIVWAEVYIPDTPDSDGDFMSAEDIQKAAYGFMRAQKLGKIDQAHNNVSVSGASVVESFIARKGDQTFVEGSWVVGMHVPDDDTWAKIEKGEINGFSMEAFVTKTPTQLMLDIPAVITGITSKADDDHEHQFHAMYDPVGNFIGGRTSEAQDGHFHLIKRGTVTEYDVPGGHRHRFAVVDAMRGAQDV